MSQHGYQPSFRNQIQSDKTMDLFIETLTGTAFEMTVSPFDTVMSIKSKIQRVEGIPVSHQHLLYNTLELEDASCLIDYSIQDGATLKLVLSMRGGPISTRRLPVGKEIAWKEHLRELVEGRQEDGRDRLPPGARVTVFVFGEGSQMNLVRVIENDDGSYTPLSESWSGSSFRNLFAEEDPEQSNKRLQENSVTMGKMQDLQHKMETLTMQRKPKNSSPDAPSPTRPLLSRRVTARPQNSIPNDSTEHLELRNEPSLLQLPQLVACDTLPAPYQNSPHSLESTNALLDARDSMPTKKKEYRLSRREVKPEPSGRRPGRGGSLLLDIKPKRTEGLPNHFRDVKKPLIDKETFIPPNITIADEEADSFRRRSQAAGASSEVVSVSPARRDRVLAQVANSGHRYRLSRFVLERDDDDDDAGGRPKTSPDGLESRPQLRDVLAEAGWPRHRAARRPRVPCGMETQLDFRHDEFVAKERSAEAADVDVAVRSPRYGRRSLGLPSIGTKCSQEKQIQEVYRPTMSDEGKPESDDGKPDAASPESASVAAVDSDVATEPTESPSAAKAASVRVRCWQCKKRLNITNMYTCRCGQVFCAAHRHCETHRCTFDYKSHGRRQIQEANPVVSAPKLPKI